MPKRKSSKKPLKLTESNYYTREADVAYMSVSQYKSFVKCEAEAMAKLHGEYASNESNTSLLVGSYVDSYFEGTLDDFREHHKEIFKKDGSLKSEYIKAEEIIKKIESDEVFMRFMSGEKQVILTFELFGVWWKIKIDSFVKDKCITDLKTARNTEGLPKWRYDIQGGVYQKGVELNSEENYEVSKEDLTEIKKMSVLKENDVTESDYEKWFLGKSGIRKDIICDFSIDRKTKVITYKKRLPFYLAVATKEDIPELNIFQIPQSTLDLALDEVRENLPHIIEVKTGKIAPTRCEKCDYCKLTKKTVIRNYNELLE